jgi:integrase
MMAKKKHPNLFKRYGKYYVRWRVGGKLFTRCTGKTELRDALKERDKILAPVLARNEIDVLQNVAARIEGKKAELDELDEQEHPPLTIERAWLAYVHAVNRPHCGEVTLEQYRCSFTKFKRWLKKNYPHIQLVRDVTRRIAEEYGAFLVSEKLAPRTFNKHIIFLILFHRVLWDQARMGDRPNPWDRIQRRRGVTNSRRELTADELTKVCASTEGEMRLLFALGIYAGMRLGDCATLRWNEIDMQRRFIRRVPNKSSRRTPKAVTVPIHKVLLDMLNELPHKTGTAEFVLPETAALYERDKHWLSRKIQKQFTDAGIQTQKPGTGPGTGKRAVVEVGFHSLRHTFVSLCREAGAPLAVVEAIVGHSSPAMTRHYPMGEAAKGVRDVGSLPRQEQSEATGTNLRIVPIVNPHNGGQRQLSPISREIGDS